MFPRRNSIAASTCTASNGNHCAIVNTPFQAAETPTVPEILEMQMSSHINQVPMMNPLKTTMIMMNRKYDQLANLHQRVVEPWRI